MKKWIEKNTFINNKAKELRCDIPKSERWFICELSKAQIGIKFKNNRKFLGRIPDFISKKHKIIIEVDGNVHDLTSVKLIDKIKDDLYKNNGYTVIRVLAYSNKSFIECLDKINDIVKITPKKKKKKKTKKINNINNSISKLESKVRSEIHKGVPRYKIANKMRISKSIIDKIIKEKL
jgi:very-short-patch-repair endonuclease